MGKLRETLIDELRDVLDAEKQLLKALPKLARAAEHEDLKAAFVLHTEETKGHVERLNRVFKSLGETPRGKHCPAMEGLVEEGAELIEEDAGDAALICGAQKAEHYEIATYGSLAAWAKLLGEEEAAGLLEETLEEEKATDEKLTELAESIVNADDEAETKNEEAPAKRASKAKKK